MRSIPNNDQNQFIQKMENHCDLSVSLLLGALFAYWYIVKHPCS